jgi:hypothetical protein
LIVINGDSKILETILESMRINMGVLLIRESRGAADLLSNIIFKFNQLKFNKKKLISTNDQFYEQFEGEINEGHFSLDLIKQIVNLYHDRVQEDNVILINSVLFENESLETAVLKTITNSNSKY